MTPSRDAPLLRLFVSYIAAMEAITKTDIINEVNIMQSEINSAFSLFCDPECSNVAVDVFDDCGYFKNMTGV